MSLSTLGAQLASLNSKQSANPGSLAVTSRRTKDAIGRGLEHSAIHGHAHHSQNRLLVPSILYEDAKSAADVPLTTLRENAYSAWQVLLANESTACGMMFGEEYKKLMNLSSLQCERGLLTPSENLQLNKLIRPVLFWIGAVLMNETSNRSPTSPFMNGLHVLEYLLRRHDVHIHNGRELILSLLPHHSEAAVFGRVLQLVDVASIPEFTFLRPYATPGTTALPNTTVLASQTSKDKALVTQLCDLAQFFGCKPSTSRGRKNILSFVSKILAQAMKSQVRRSGSCEEPTIRLMLPYVLQACSSMDEEFQSFGYVLVSTLSEFVEFSKEMLEKLTNVIWQNVNSDNIDIKLILLMDLTPPTETLRLRYKKQPLKAIRISQTSNMLSSEQYDAEVVLPPVLGHMYKQDGFTCIAAFIMYLLDWSFETRNLSMILGLVKESSLKQVWSNVFFHAITETLIDYVVSAREQDEEMEDSVMIEMAEKIVNELRQLNTALLNQAVARVVMNYRNCHITIKQLIAKVLGMNLPSSSITDDSSSTVLLPPRVALEHADASVRRQAMDDLVKDKKDKDWHGSMMALLRHVSMEEEPTMILAAAQALRELASLTKGKSLRREFEEHLTNILLEKDEKLEEEVASILMNLIQNKKIEMDDDSSDTNNRLVTYLVAHSEFTDCTDKNKKTKTEGKNMKAEAAIQCLRQMFIDGKTTKDAHIVVQNGALLDFIVKAGDSCSKDLRRSAILNIIQAMYTHRKRKGAKDKILPYKVIGVLIDSFGEDKDSTTILGKKKKMLLSAIKNCVKLVCKQEDDTNTIQMVMKAASISSEVIYEELLIPGVLETTLAATSSIMLFMEASLQLPNPSTVVRLLTFLARKQESYQEEGKMIIPVLALFGHDDSSVRQAALDLHDKMSNKYLQEVSNSAILMDGITALPALLRNNKSEESDVLKYCANICENWISFRGHQRALSIILSAIELAGEASYSLDSRWSLAGKPIFNKLLAFDDEALDKSSSLVEVIVRMFKGALVNDPSEIFNMVIVKGSGRARSYSVGRASGVSLADPYPDGMIDDIVKSLESACDDESDGNNYISSCVLSTVFGSDSWCNKIFKERLNRQDRMRIANQLLQLQTAESSKAFLRLPLPAGDINSLLKENCQNLVALATLMDYIRSSPVSSSSAEITNETFAILESLSSSSGMLDNDGSMDFVRHNTLLAILEYCHSLSSSPTTEIQECKVERYTKLLVALVGGSDSTFDSKKSAFHPLTSWKSKKTALSILSLLCSQEAAKVVPSMLAAFLNCVQEDKELHSSRSEIISTIVPVFHRYCSASKLSMLDLWTPFLNSTAGDNGSQFQQSMIATLSSLEDNDCSALADFICLLLAKRITKVAPTNAFLAQLEPSLQINCVRQLCNRLDKAIMGQPISDIVKSPTNHFFAEVSGLILQILANKLVQDYIQASDVSSLCLQLWQDLMVLQTTIIQQTEINGDENTVRICKKKIDHSLTGVQYLLPIPVFLASVTALIEDGEESNQLCKSRALRMISERTSEVDPMAPEADLFMELMPLILRLIKTDKNDIDVMIQQDAAVVIERLIRSFYLSPSVNRKNDEGPILDALKVCAERLSDLSSNKENDINSKLACSFALCTATLLKYLKARALPSLPKIMDSVLDFLSSTESDDGIDRDTQSLVHASMLQTVKAIVDSLPQFMIPHLGKILTPAILPSFRDESNDLGATLANRVPARQLIPALSRALQKCSDAFEYQIILSLTTSSIEKTSSRHEIGAVKSHVLKIILLSCDFDVSLMDFINKTLIAMVMKISEAQLRSIYTSIREWRGDDNHSRKFAFWALSAALSKELKSIFIPCFTSVLNDAIGELESAVPILCKQGQMSKKAKVGSIDSLLYLPALIACLNQIFSADAREGGDWLREDGDKRYHTFVEPLTKLLLARVPSDFPFSTGTSKNGYRQLIVDDGGLISCIISLASAAGNDILWKSLNHSVLTACGNEDYVEIRQAGLTCLLKLIQTLGEEYMVLIPECLPVLSELLEAEEETAALARDCVELSEDLLGESLEDSL